MHYALYTVPYLNYVPRTLPTLSGVYVTSYSRTHPVPPSSRYPPPPQPTTQASIGRAPWPSTQRGSGSRVWSRATALHPEGTPTLP